MKVYFTLFIKEYTAQSYLTVKSRCKLKWLGFTSQKLIFSNFLCFIVYFLNSNGMPVGGIA